MAMNTNVSTIATATLTAIRALTIDAVPTGASRSRRSSLFLRHPTRVSAAPNAPPEAMAQPSSPGVRYWIGLSDLSSTCWVASWKAGGRPEAAWFAACTSPANTLCTTPAVVGLAIE
jgi:hypothetical protein